jgi:hypothetical protein
MNNRFWVGYALALVIEAGAIALVLSFVYFN